MGRLLDEALGDLQFGSLFGPGEWDEEDGVVDMRVDEVADVGAGAGDEDQHVCDAGEAPEDMGRYWE